MAFNENYMRGLAPESVEGVITCTHFVSSLASSEAKKFVAKSQAMFQSSVTRYRELSPLANSSSYMVESHYGLILMLDMAIDLAKSTNKVPREHL